MVSIGGRYVRKVAGYPLCRALFSFSLSSAAACLSYLVCVFSLRPCSSCMPWLGLCGDCLTMSISIHPSIHLCTGTSFDPREDGKRRSIFGYYTNEQEVAPDLPFLPGGDPPEDAELPVFEPRQFYNTTWTIGMDE